MFDCFEKSFEDICMNGISEYLSRRGEADGQYQKLSEKQDKILQKMLKIIESKKLVYQYEAVSNAMETYHINWVYQKAFHDYTYLLRKMGVLALGEYHDEEFTVDRQTYHNLIEAAEQKGISVDQLVHQCCEEYLKHLEEMQKEEKRENK